MWEKENAAIHEFASLAQTLLGKKPDVHECLREGEKLESCDAFPFDSDPSDEQKVIVEALVRKVARDRGLNFRILADFTRQHPAESVLNRLPSDWGCQSVVFFEAKRH